MCCATTSGRRDADILQKLRLPKRLLVHRQLVDKHGVRLRHALRDQFLGRLTVYRDLAQLEEFVKTHILTQIVRFQKYDIHSSSPSTILSYNSSPFILSPLS